LSLFGMRPAPVQATYLGYPGTTGLRTMDYRITSEAYDPTGLAEQYHTEKLIRMPGLLAPFQPQGDAPVAPSPHANGAPFTFGCLNPIWRITPSVMRAWGAILRARPDARMMLGNAGTPMLVQFLINKFAEQGISADRLILEGRKNHPDYLALHNRIDLSLDTFPYNGGTTTTYSLWMGVPVVTLAGVRTAARSGVCILSEAGMMDFVAKTEEDYVARALDWASRPDDLSALREKTRARVKVGASEDQALLASQFGDALRQMWRNWCADA
jgi:protein O-GlcNAc transferase